MSPRRGREHADRTRNAGDGPAAIRRIAEIDEPYTASTDDAPSASSFEIGHVAALDAIATFAERSPDRSTW